MKTIMAEAATASTIPQSPVSTLAKAVGTAEAPNAGLSTSPKSFQKPSQRQRRRMDGQTPLVGSDPIQQVVSSTSPWKLPERQATASGVSLPVRELHSDVPIRAMHSVSPTPHAVSQSSKAQVTTPISLLPIPPKSSLRPDTVPELVPRRSHR